MWEGVNPHDQRDSARWRKRTASNIFTMLSHIRKVRYNEAKRKTVMRQLDAEQRASLALLANMAQRESAEVPSSQGDTALQTQKPQTDSDEATHP